jgi:predicted PurR-regulated permease PerM
MWLFISKYKELIVIVLLSLITIFMLSLLTYNTNTYHKLNQKEFNNKFDSLNNNVKNIDKHIESIVEQDIHKGTTIQRKEKSYSQIKLKNEKDSIVISNASDKYIDSLITSELDKRR